MLWLDQTTAAAALGALKTSDVIALVAAGLSTLSLLVAGGALAWQILSWLYDGRRVRTGLVHGLRSAYGAYTRGISRRHGLVDLSKLSAQGVEGVEVLGVVVTNIGRAPVRVDAYEVKMHPHGLAFMTGSAIGPRLPHRLPAGESETWFVEMADVRALAKTDSHTHRRVVMRVTLGTGDVRRTRGLPRL